MEEKDKTGTFERGRNNKNDCDCKDNCCPPKKKNIFSKLIFAVILLAAIGIIAVKLFYQPAQSANKHQLNARGNASCCDTTSSKTCDTTKGSSCCPKNK